MKEVIYDVIKRNIRNSINVNDDTAFTEAGIDSVEFITLIIELEEEFNIRFEDMQLVYSDYETIGQLVTVVQHVMKINIAIDEEARGQVYG